MKSAGNIFYILLVATSVLFLVTVFANSLLPRASQPEWFFARGWQIALAELGLMIVFGLLSMYVDKRETK
jgi:hypothetical protein